VTHLINTANKKKGPDGKRLLTLLEVLYSTGLRVSELVGLPLSAISADRRTHRRQRQERQRACHASVRTCPSRVERILWTFATCTFCRAAKPFRKSGCSRRVRLKKVT
jgi:integrase